MYIIYIARLSGEHDALIDFSSTDQDKMEASLRYNKL